MAHEKAIYQALNNQCQDGVKFQFWLNYSATLRCICSSPTIALGLSVYSFLPFLLISDGSSTSNSTGCVQVVLSVFQTNR